jgi:predicted RNA-binding protein YlqC (UPF0109 family)
MSDLTKLSKAQLVALIEGLGQNATPAPVAEVVVEAAPVVESASDKLKAFVESEGKLFARGGRTIWTLKNLQAAVNVLKTGEPTIVPLDGVGSYGKRGVQGIAIGVGDDAKSVLTQFVYTPQV